MRIYLACTVRGDRGAVAALRELVRRLETGGHVVLTKHLLEHSVEASESALTERQVFDRDIQWLDACDVLIADASGSSFGVGFEVGYVLGRSDRTQQRVLLLYCAARRDVISRLIVGLTHPRCTLIEYMDTADLLERFADSQLATGNWQLATGNWPLATIPSPQNPHELPRATAPTLRATPRG